MGTALADLPRKDCLIVVTEGNTCKLSPLGSKKVEEDIINE